MNTTALIVMDVQNCFITRNNSTLPKKIKQHIDTHPYTHIIFSQFLNDEQTNFARKLDWHKCTDPLETAIVEELAEIASQNYIFIKNTYSLFKCSHFVDFLKKQHITKLFFCGLDSDACILASLFEAFDLGYDFEIIQELTGTSGKDYIFDASLMIINRNLQK